MLQMQELVSEGLSLPAEPGRSLCPSCEGHHSALLPKPLALPVPPRPASRHGHTALLSEMPGCLSVCLSGHSSRQGELQLCAGVPAASFSRAKRSEWPSSRALFCCLFVCSFIKTCTSSKNRKIMEVVCLCERIVLRGYRHNSHIPHA